jgi:hypothetical protein
MNLQINLLKKSEQRYQGIVSMKVMVLGSAAGFAGFLLLFGMLAGIARVTVLANLERTRREWTRQEPLAAVVRLQTAAIVANRKTHASLDEWSERTGAPVFKIIRELQSSVPTHIQLSRAFVGITDTGSSGHPECVLQLSGWAEGEGGELLAVEFKRNLNNSSELRGFCDEVRLISSRRESDTSWVFSLEGKRIIQEAP